MDTTFVLQYDADTLRRGSASLSSGNETISQPQLDDILRDKSNKRSDVKTLKFAVERPCPIWCPGIASVTFSPKAGCEAAFQQFAALAKETTLHIVFDYKHVRKEHQSMFRLFSKAARVLHGYPIQASLSSQGFKQASWEVLAPVGTAGAPPAYNGSLIRKRPRQTSPSSPTQPLKRLAAQSPTALHSPEPRSCESHTSDKTIPFSPETAAAALRRALRGESPGHDFQAEAINTAIEKLLPAHINKAYALQSDAIEAAVAKQLSAYIDAALQTEAIDAAVSKQLDTLVRALLPTALEDLLASRSSPSSPAISFTSIDSRGNKYPKLPRLTPLGKTIMPHLRTHLTDEFQKHQTAQLQRFTQLVDKTLADLETSAYDDRARETAEFEEAMEEHKVDISLLKRDTINSLWRETEEAFAQGREEGWALGDDINDRLSGLCDKIENIKRLRLRKMVTREVSRQSYRRKRVRKGVGKAPVRAHCSLLGRRREEEWVDC